MSRLPTRRSRGQHVRRPPARERSPKLIVLVAVAAGAAVAMGLLGAKIAFAFWSNSDSSFPASAQADALPQGNTPTSAAATPNPNSNTVAVQFLQATTSNGDVAIPASNYSINRYPASGGTPVAQSASCSGSGTVICDVSGVPDGFWIFTDTPFYGSNWLGQESGPSPTVTVDTTPPTVTVSYPASGSTYGGNWSGSISGTASDATSGVASVALSIENTTTGKWWSGSAFSAAAATFVPATGTTAWTYPLAAASLVNGDHYSVTAQATDGVGNVGTSPPSTFTYSTTTVTVAISYPVTGTTYGADWSGTITGTSSSPNTVTAVQVAVENTTASTWWNGSAFSAPGATYEPATGTTSWNFALGAADLVPGDAYSVTAQATDSLSNTATSVADAFVYNTTPPVPVVTYPVTGTIYGADWTGKLTGTATFTNTASSDQVAIENTTTGYWYNGTNFTTATSQTFLTATGTTSWTYSLAAAKFATGDSYSVVVRATDKAGNVGTSASVSFTYSTAAPTATVVYPASNNITYGADWTGTISGTATYVNPASHVTVVIKNATAGLWWNGTSFAATTSTAVAAAGTTSWSYALGADDLVSGDKYTIVAHAYDTAGNGGTSATRTFTYNTTPPTATVTYPASGGTYGGDWTGTMTGTASFTISAASVSLSVENTTTSQWWNGSGFAASGPTFETATGTTSWSYPLAAANLVSGDSYSVVAEATDTAGNVGFSAADSFTYNTTPPTPAVTYPVTGTTYGADWSGTVSGTAVFPNGSGSVSLAIENLTTTHWWNGTTFNATSQTFVAVTGTTSWSYALAGTKLASGDGYAVVAKATDAIGNVGTTTAVSFTYNTTAPTVAVSYPAPATTYGTDWSGAISGTASFTNGASSVALAVENTTTSLWWNGSAFAASGQSFEAASGTTSWSYPLAATNLVSGDSYSVVAEATDLAGNVGSSTSHTFTFNATPPTVVVTYPVAGTTYGPNYTGTITGTASFTNGASSVALAVENTTTSLWWNGSAFAAPGQSFEAATGTTSWSYPLVATNLVSGDNYSVVAEATDTAGNVGTSSADAFSYDPIGLAGLAWVNPTGGTPTCGGVSATRTCTVSGVGVGGTWSADVEMANSSGTALSNVSGAAISFVCTATNATGGPVESPASPGTLTLAASGVASSPLSITGPGTAWSVTETCTATIQGSAYSLDVAATS